MPGPELTKHTVPATAAAYLFQFRRAIAILAAAHNGDIVGIETLDDVAIESPHGELVLEQDKLTTKKGGNNLGDSSENLLNTLSTWLEALIAGEISPDTTRFLLVTNVIHRGGLVRQIAEATSMEDAQGCLEAVRRMKETSAPKRRLLALLAKPRGQDMFLRLCQAMQLLDGEETSVDSVEGCLQISTAFESNRTIIFEALSGWISEVAFQAWTAGKPCRIGKQAYINQLDAILEKMKREKRREKPPGQIPLSEEDIARQKGAVFVRQVGLVTDDESIKTEAICDYLQCITEKIRLSEEGEITNEDWIDFGDRLERRWTSIWRRNKTLAGETEEAIGFRTLNDVLSPDHHPYLAGEPTTQVYLANGTYHRLSDEKAIGWHPRYRELLDEGETDGHSV